MILYIYKIIITAFVMYVYLYICCFVFIQQCFYYERSSFELSKFYSKQYKQENDRTNIK